MKPHLYKPRFARVCLFLLVTGLLAMLIDNPAPALAHNPGPAAHNKAEIEKHRQLDFGFKGFDKVDAELRENFENYNDAVNAFPVRSPWMVAAAQAPNAHLVGSWSPVYQWPVVSIFTMLLPNGKVLAWDSINDLPTENNPVHNTTRAMVWDPATNQIVRVDNNTGYNLFCAGFAHLPDGRMLIAGGNLNQGLAGTNTIHIFNHENNSWTLGPFMQGGGRWYPSVIPLANGEMLIISGGPDLAEVWTNNGTLRPLSDAILGVPLYPWMHLASNGLVFYFGPDDVMRWLSTAGRGRWDYIGPRDGVYRDYGSYAMYDVGRILASGGGNSVRSSVVIDIRNPARPTVTPTGPMATGRRQHNLSVLPDGTVLVIGGNDNGTSLVDKNASVYTSELWNPATGAWRTLSNYQRGRQYHSISMLLPDGRVLVAGGGICGPCYEQGYLEKNAEIFSPPYLFRKDGSGQLAPRPTIASAPSQLAYRRAFSVMTPNAAAIRQTVLMRLPSVTHSVDFEQRRVPLTFTARGGAIDVTPPDSPNLAPPGPYMLFLIDDQGVPSVGQILSLAEAGGGPPAAPEIASALAFTGGVTLNWGPVTGATSYTVRYGTTPGVYGGQLVAGNTGSANMTGLTANVRYYFVVAASNSAGTGPDSGEVSAVPQGADPVVPIGGGTGLSAQYFNNADLTSPAFTRTDATVNFDWYYESPATTISPDTFSVRWTGQVQPRYTGSYTFYALTDDGVRLWVNNQLIIDKWIPQAPTENTGTIQLTGGQRYDIRLEYYEDGGYATAKLSWSSPAQQKEIIPATQLYTPTAPPPPPPPVSGGTGLTASYFDNVDFTALRFTRIDPKVDFDWYYESPDARIAADTFSIRWTGQVAPRYTETYTFTTLTDDGVRLWINNQLIIDKWLPQVPTEYSGTIRLTAGQRYDIRMEYEEIGGYATAKLFWSSPSQLKEAVPASQLFP
ncbi:MAG: PA14 domain-containing protein [Blastocatellia bacterium]